MSKAKLFSKALITGATSGIGEALAYFLASKGISLLLSGRNLDKLKGLEEALKRQVSVETLQADLANSEDLQKLTDWLKIQQPDLVINNAGFGLYGKTVDLSLDNQMQLVEVNVVALTQLTIEAAKSMVENNINGTILNISSAASYQIFPHFAIYAASKAFVTTFSRSIDFELQKKGIRVLVSCPGQIDTHFYNRAGGAFKNRTQLMVMNLEEAIDHIWWQLKKKKQVHIFDWKYRLVTYLSMLIPAKWLAPFLSRSIEERKPR